MAVIPQVLTFQVKATSRLISNDLTPYILVISFTALLVFVAANLQKPGFWALGAGLLANFSVIVLNKGWMPISPDTLHIMEPSLPVETWVPGHRLGISKDTILPISDTTLWWLSDRFTLPAWIPYKVAFSIGDIAIAMGAFLLIWSLSNPKQEN